MIIIPISKIHLSMILATFTAHHRTTAYVLVLCVMCHIYNNRYDNKTCRGRRGQRRRRRRQRKRGSLKPLYKKEDAANVVVYGDFGDRCGQARKIREGSNV